jgi:hypothetical protein
MQISHTAELIFKEAMKYEGTTMKDREAWSDEV